MSPSLARLVLAVLGLYLACGAAFAPFFLARGLSRVSAASRGASAGFRVVIVPGVVALWPILARQWASAAGSTPGSRT